MKNKTLVIIDLQNDITKNYKDIIGNVNRAADAAKDGGMNIVYIKHNNLSEGTRTFKAGTKGENFVSELHVLSDNVFTKTKGNALTSDEFTKYIAENAKNEFFVCGADATACVKSTVFNMKKCGYDVVVLSDCVTSYDKKKIPEMLEYYESKGCALMPVAEFLKTLKK